MRILGCAHRSPRPPLPPPPDPRTVEDLSANLKPYQQKHWRHVPRFLTPLKPHTVTRAFLGNLRPTVTLYKGHVNITANSKFWYNSTSSVCTIVIPTCTLKDSGEYCVLVENKLGKDCSSSKLTVYGEGAKPASGLRQAWRWWAPPAESYLGWRRKMAVLWEVDPLFSYG